MRRGVAKEGIPCHRLNTSEPVYGTTCKHGPLECAGNVHELCAAKYAGDSSAWWPFLHCLNHQGLELIGLEGIAVYCAQIAKIDWVDSGIETCVNGEEGPRLLRESVGQSQKLGIQLSDMFTFHSLFTRTHLGCLCFLGHGCYTYAQHCLFSFPHIERVAVF